jgi:hypothetical protein
MGHDILYLFTMRHEFMIDGYMLPCIDPSFAQPFKFRNLKNNYAKQLYRDGKITYRAEAQRPHPAPLATQASS